MSQEPEFTFIGEISDEAIEALAQLLLSIVEPEDAENQDEVCQEPRS